LTAATYTLEQRQTAEERAHKANDHERKENGIDQHTTKEMYILDRRLPPLGIQDGNPRQHAQRDGERWLRCYEDQRGKEVYEHAWDQQHDDDNVDDTPAQQVRTPRRVPHLDRGGHNGRSEVGEACLPRRRLVHPKNITRRASVSNLAKS